ncbi:MAG: hypothetical protein M3457_09155 [Chloroflexota bacterium]|nr:hypothetical protein [Chloroflexota bacterium]
MTGTSKFSNKRLRDLERIAHLVVGAIVLLYVYGLWGDSAAFTLFVRVFAFPVLVGSGMAMWQLPRVRRWWAMRRPVTDLPT